MYEIFNYYLVVNSNQMRVSKEFDLTQGPDSKRIRLCFQLFMYWEYSKRKQPLGSQFADVPQ